LFRRVAVLVTVVSVAGVTRAVATNSSSAKPKPSHAQDYTAAAVPGSGYWLIGADGNVYPFGVSALGSLSANRPARPITGAAPTPSGSGYWLVGTDGGIFSFGDAKFFGSTGAMRLNKPIVGMAATPSGRGYWLVASDGGIFAFGDAGFYGSTGSIILNKPINGMSASMSGRGYRFVASDGGLFSFGDAPYAGSGAGKRLRDPIVAMAGSPTGNGYWLVGAGGAVQAFGDVASKGGTSNGPIPAPIVAIITPPKAPDGAAAPVAPGGPAAPAPSEVAPAAAPTGPFQIAMLGDTGYSADQDKLLLKTRTAISSLPYAFVVHDGDIQHPSEPCTDERLRYVHEVFDGFTAPFIYTPGDNEWADCSGPEERLEAIRRTFFATDRSLGQRRIALARQAAPFIENARWSMGNVVFATVNVPGPNGESSGANGLAAANKEWLNAAFDVAERQGSPGVMIIWQDDPFDGPSDGVEDILIERAGKFGKPVVLVHGDTHTYRLEKSWRQAPNLIELQTFALEDTDWWVQVTVDPASAGVFTFEKKQS
jgi:hypothetical protein